MSQYKITRQQADLLLALKKHISLLKEYYQRAFQENNINYYGEIAGKLRLLVYEKGQRGLLTSLMEETGINIPIVLGGPPIKKIDNEPGAGDEVSLKEYLGLLAYAVRTPHGLISVTKIDLIKMWAQQDGSAHEDWKHDEEYVSAKEMELFIGNRHALAVELKITTETVLFVAEKFMEKIS